MDGLCPIQSDPHGPVFPTARPPWHGFCKYPVGGFALFTLYQTGGRIVSEFHPPPERPYPLDHEGRIARLEGIVEQIDVRLGRIETKIDANRQAIDGTRKELETKIDANRQAIDGTRKELETRIDANRQAIDGTRKELETKIDATQESLETKIDANRQAIDGARKELETKIDANRQAIDGTRKELLRWVIALHVATWGLIGALKLFG